MIASTVVDRQSLPGLLPDVVFSSQDAVFDEWGDGVGTSKWTISGTRAGGRAFTVTRANRWASRGDVTIDPAYDVAAAADALLNNDFEDVRIDKVAFSHELSTKFEQLHITRMRVAVNGGRLHPELAAGAADLPGRPDVDEQLQQQRADSVRIVVH